LLLAAFIIEDGRPKEDCGIKYIPAVKFGSRFHLELNSSSQQQNYIAGWNNKLHSTILQSNDAQLFGQAT
jgi:hypothetical protein